MDSHKTIKKLIDRYDYGGALDILKEMELQETDPAILINSCRYAVNFDFKTARYLLGTMSKQDDKDVKKITGALKKALDEMKARFESNGNDKEDVFKL